MSGYRQHGFDPNAQEQPGPPLRPYNSVQWTGVALAAAGLTLSTLDIGRQFGLLPRVIDDPSPWSFILLLLGVALIYSRRHPATDIAPELAAARRRWLIIVVTICAAILGIAAAIDLQGVR
ncbi:hypothetical protein [Sphingomonas sp.]|uniref:hypothetical protein n=1 Tax=Sphingomonas sp. TaxID=28214 RepID=UPI00286E21A7|nr:hypothetical protein [Sphingomonas sp.]